MMKPARVESLAWVLIYGGLASAMLGLWALQAGAALAALLAWGGGALAVAGVGLVWWRSRMRVDAAPDAAPGERR